MKTEGMVLRGHGGPEVLARETFDLDEPGPREVRVRVRAVALNHLDLWVRRGLPNLKLEYPHRLGSDIVGEVEALGPGARGPEAKVGQKVVVNPGTSCGVCERCLSGQDNLCPRYRILGEHVSGGYARHVNVPDANLLPYPARAPNAEGAGGELAWEQVAAMPLVFLTAWQMVVRHAQVKAGDLVLVQAGGSGVGSAAIQIAKRFGARVITTAGSDEKCAAALELGADAAVNYRTHDFVAECRRFAGDRSQAVDAVIDHVGGEVFEKSIAAVRWGGRIVTCGATAGFTPNVDLRHIFFRQVQILGSTMGPKGDLFRILSLAAEGKLRPVVGKVASLWDAADAHRSLEAREVFGKIVLRVD
jgi:NADPH:quinone reductase-like Zn-dependent oxidoreductase